MKIEISLQKLLQNKRKLYSSVIIVIVVAFFLTVFFIFFLTPRPQKITVLNINNPDSVIKLSDKTIPPILYYKIPDLQELDADERKKIFIDVILPTTLLAQRIIENKRAELIKIKEKEFLSHQDSLLLDSMLLKFNAKDIDDLILRLHPHPVSITIAQAATESAWGTSRFCREANNLFGIWSFSKNDKRIAAGKTRDKQTVYLRKYDSLPESILDYLYTIARSAAFKDFREARSVSDNPYRLIWFLQNYSEKRLEYVITLRNMLEHNDLHQYDNFVLPKIDKRDSSWTKLIQ